MRKKKNFRKLPSKIQAKLPTLNTDYIEVGVSTRFLHSEIAKGELSSLGVTINENDELQLTESVIPPKTNGRTSLINLDGKEIIRKDLPKIIKTYSMEVPSWGSHSSYHTVYIDREVYEREVIPPHFHKIDVELLREEVGDTKAYMLKFKINTPFLKEDIDFDSDLLFALNLLQENIGESDIFELDASDDDYLATQYLGWEIFPPGQQDQIFTKFVRGNRKVNSTTQARIEERYNFLLGFHPTSFIKGSNGFKNYFGAKFDQDVVVFENIDYGNAIYVIKEEWEELSKLSRIELMKKYQGQFTRIVHGKGWKDKLKQTIKELTS